MKLFRKFIRFGNVICPLVSYFINRQDVLTGRQTYFKWYFKKKVSTSFVLCLGYEWLLSFSYFACTHVLSWRRVVAVIIVLSCLKKIYFISIYPTSQSYNSCQVKDPAPASSQTTVTSSSVSSYQFCQKHVCFVFCKCLREIFNKPNWPSIPNCKSMQGFVTSWSHWMASQYIAFDHISFQIEKSKRLLRGKW